MHLVAVVDGVSGRQDGAADYEKRLNLLIDVGVTSRWARGSNR